MDNRDLLNRLKDNIRTLEDMKREVDKQIRLAYESYQSFYNVCRKPEVSGTPYKDYSSDSARYFEGDEVTFCPYAYYNPLDDTWGAFVELEVNGGRGAADPSNYGWFATPEEALAIADGHALVSSQLSAGK